MGNFAENLNLGKRVLPPSLGKCTPPWDVLPQKVENFVFFETGIVQLISKHTFYILRHGSCKSCDASNCCL